MDCFIVEDETELADAVSEYFGLFGIEAEWAPTLESARKRLETDAMNAPCFLLDVNLPDGSGYEFSKAVRQKFPAAKILFLSARREDFDILKGYAVGGDDYIVKPCSLPVLLAKVKHALGKDRLETVGSLQIDPKKRLVMQNGEVVGLKNMEFNLLYYLYSHRGTVLDKERILMDVWGEGYYSDNTLNVHINRIREKLGDTSGELIQTVWGIGYRFQSC